MVTQIFDTSNRRALIFSVQSILRVNGWSVVHVPEHRRLDFNIKKNDADLSLKFLDGSDLQYKSASSLLEDMAVDGKSLFGIESRHIIWVYGNRFLDPFQEHLASQDIIAINFDSISILDEICDADKVNIEEMDFIRLMLLKRSVRSCVKIAARYERGGDLTTAVEWLRAGTRATTSFSAAHRQLFYTLIKFGRKEEAYMMGKDMLSMRPEARTLASAMVNLATTLNREQDVARWKALQKPEHLSSVQSKDFENLVTKMAQADSLSNVQKDRPSGERHGQTFMGKLRRKLFKGT
jgi:hypothetical protein